MQPLSPDLLRRRCDPAILPFETTESLEALDVLGQDRALEAIRLGIGIEGDGYNVFAMGPTETGKRTVVRALLASRAKGEPVPQDACYVHDFERPHCPKVLLLRAGQGLRLKRDVEHLVDELRAAIPAAVSSDEHRSRKQLIEEEVKERHDKGLEELREKAKARGIALLHAPMGFIFAPLKGEDIITPAEFEELPKEDQERLQEDTEELQEELQGLISRTRGWAREAREKLRQLVKDLATSVVAPLVGELEARYAEVPGVLAHLAAIRRHAVENVGDFLGSDEPGPATARITDPENLPNPSPHRRYLVNVVVDRTGETGAPVVHENNPTLQNLVGRVEHLVHVGALLTDLHLIRAGSLHRANGGYLVLDAHSLLMQPFAYDALKRALRSREVRIESPGQILSMASTLSLEPEPVPLDVKVVLLGERLLYYLLDRYDPEFRTLFKVVADFEEDLPREDGADLAYARLVASVARRESLRPLRREAVARVIEDGARRAGDTGRLSAHVGMLAELLREADHRAAEAGRDAIAADDISQAVAAAERREGRIRDAILDEIRRGTLLIDTAGRRAGQVNGLSVMQLARTAFGRPSRITARVRLGKGEVVDIEREVELGGPLHSKGVLILSAFLGARYAPGVPLSLSATLAFEQSYGPVEGDSASAGELIALLSALADVPVAQSIAITGSVNQHGELQPIGGVNEKIEGFFDACSVCGLTGEQGVVIPESNVKHLMLREDVVEAARAGRFRVFAASTVDEAMEILTGRSAGERDAAGAFPLGSVNQLVEARLLALAERRSSGERPWRGHEERKP